MKATLIWLCVFGLSPLAAQTLDKSVAKAFDDCNEGVLGHYTGHYEFVEAKDEQGRTPLHLAAEHGCALLMRQMMGVKSPPINERTTEEKYTPLHYAVQLGNRPEEKAQIVQLLLDQGAEVNALSDNKQTPLHLFFLENRGADAPDAFKKTFLALMAKEADVRQEDHYGKTPLYYAFAENKKNFLGLKGIYIRLFEAGADPTKETLEELSLMDYAKLKPAKAQNKALIEAWETFGKKKD